MERERERGMDMSAARGNVLLDGLVETRRFKVPIPFQTHFQPDKVTPLHSFIIKSMVMVVTTGTWLGGFR